MKLPPRAPFFGRDTQGVPNEVGLFVPPEAVFPGTPSTAAALIEVLASLSRDDTLFHSARTNTIVSGHAGLDPKERQQILLNTLCTREEIDRINAFTAEHPGSGRPTVFFRGQMLELMRWVARHCRNLAGDGNTFTDPATRSRFVKAALIAGIVWSQRVYANRLSGGGPIEDVRRQSLGAFRKGIEEGNAAPHLGRTFGRGWSLFNDYFPRFYPDFHRDFLAATGLTLEQYMTCVTGLSTFTVATKKDGPLFTTQTVAAITAYHDILPIYLALEAQTPEQLATAWDGFEQRGYRPLRERPIMRVADGRGVILDPTFYGERLSVGPLFHVLAANAGKANTIFGAFGDAFERYATDILRRMYPSRAVLVDRLACNIPGTDASGRAFEIDAALNDVTEAVIFEMKAAWLREDAILDGTPERFIEDIRAKYGASPGSGERDKGVAQLARIIGAIARGGWTGTNGAFKDARTFYPVLVVHDQRMDAPTLGHFLAEDFTTLLGAVPTGRRVAPLTVMTINELEDMESSVANFSMRDLLADYTAACPDRLRSLRNYIAYSPYGPKIQPSADLMRSSGELIQSVQKQFFPDRPDGSGPDN